jgi:hypothetical protein
MTYTELLEKLIKELPIPKTQEWATLEELKRIAEKLDVGKKRSDD